MSNKKSNLMINVPFSWEKMPGVPKFMAYPKCAFVPGLTANFNPQVQRKLHLPLPPGSFHKPVRSVTKSLFLWEEDPFLAALLECTKDYDNYKAKDKIKKSFGTRVRMSKSFLMSCKHSVDVEEGHLLMRLSRLGSIVRRE